MSVFFCLRSGSTETDTDAIDKVAIAIPPRAFPKARLASYKSRHSDHLCNTKKLQIRKSTRYSGLVLFVATYCGFENCNNVYI